MRLSSRRRNADVALEAERKGRDRRAATESVEGQIDEQVFGAAAGDRVHSSGPVTPFTRAKARLNYPNRVSISAEF